MLPGQRSLLPRLLQSPLARRAGSGSRRGWLQRAAGSGMAGSTAEQPRQRAGSGLRVMTGSLVSHSAAGRLCAPMRFGKGGVGKVGGVGGGLFCPFCFFLVLHWNTLQQRNWKSCLKVGHSSAVSIETSSQRAVRFTSTGGAFARPDGLQPVVPVDPGPPQYPAAGQRESGRGSGQCSCARSHPTGAKGGFSMSPTPGGSATGCRVPSCSHEPQSRGSLKAWHNVLGCPCSKQGCTPSLGGGCVHRGD